ncbi:MAG TPA: porin, partial [Polyangia bacterium]|nr:porin [Polyangia bacterium]
MRRFGSQYSTFAAASVLWGLSLATITAKAEVVLHDADGWRVFTTGRGDAHYQLIDGDGDPHSMNKLVGGQLQNSSQDQNNKLFDSRIRAGFVAAQIGFGVSDKFTETLEGKAFISLWLNGIDNHKGNPPYNKDVDMREAWGALSGSFGTFLFGRTYSIFGSASGEVNLYAYEFGVGHPCVAEGSTIGCGSTGAGPLYAAPNAQFRYITPRLGGVEMQVSLADPSATPDYQITRYPRADGDINYLLSIGDSGKLVVKGQGWAQQLTKVNSTADGTVSTTAWGVMGVARLEVSGLRVGAGAWTGKGIGTNVTLQ